MRIKQITFGNNFDVTVELVDGSKYKFWGRSACNFKSLCEIFVREFHKSTSRPFEETKLFETINNIVYEDKE